MTVGPEHEIKAIYVDFFPDTVQERRVEVIELAGQHPDVIDVRQEVVVGE